MVSRRKKRNILMIITLILIVIAGCSNKKVTQEDIDRIVGRESTDTILNEANIDSEEIQSELIVSFLDVGQADCILIELPNEQNMIIDGGNRGDGPDVVKYIKDREIEKIDYVVATHPHEDHIGGLPDVISQFNIEKIYMPKKSANTKIFETLLNTINDKGKKIERAYGGMDIINDENLKVNILAPNSDNYDETNEYSVVIKVVYGNTSYLFTGDAEQDSEKEMIDRGYNLKSDVLKVGHHGGRTSSTDAFLDKVKPRYAVISTEKGNSYGHPHKEVLNRLEDLGTKILRTDEIGTVVIKSNGEEIFID